MQLNSNIDLMIIITVLMIIIKYLLHLRTKNMADQRFEYMLHMTILLIYSQDC